MTAQSALLGQIGSWKESLTQTASRLHSPKLDSDLLKRVGVRFDTDLQSGLKRLGSLEKEVRQATDLNMSGQRFQAIRSECEQALHECLAFIEGALARAGGIDAGLCRLADAMLYELSRKADVAWNRFTILADGEFFAGLSGIIRLRFADVSLWSLPICAHEFGHFIGQEMKDTTLSDMIAREKRKDPRWDSYLQEHFADLFATYSVGPAFALNCVLLRFSPSTAQQEGRTHPSDAQRVWWILQALKKIENSQRSTLPVYAYIIGEIEKLWSASLEAAGQSQELPAQDSARLSQWLEELFECVDLKIPGARYRGWLRAQEMADEFRARRTPELRKDDSIPDILNAIWICRSELEYGDGYQVSWLGDEAARLCSMVAGR